VNVISVGEIQKNTKILSNLNHGIMVMDKRAKKQIAFIYPVKKNSIIKELSGVYAKQIKKSKIKFKDIKEQAFKAALKEKYILLVCEEFLKSATIGSGALAPPIIPLKNNILQN